METTMQIDTALFQRLRPANASVADAVASRFRAEIAEPRVAETKVAETKVDSAATETFSPAYHEEFSASEALIAQNGWSFSGGEKITYDNAMEVLGGIGEGESISWTLSESGSQTQDQINLYNNIKIEVDFLELDGWNGDMLEVFVNDHKIELGPFKANGQKEEFSGVIDVAYGKQISWDMTSSDREEINHPPSTQNYAKDQQHKLTISIDPGALIDDLHVSFEPQFDDKEVRETLALNSFTISQAPAHEVQSVFNESFDREDSQSLHSLDAQEASGWSFPQGAAGRWDTDDGVSGVRLFPFSKQSAVWEYSKTPDDLKDDIKLDHNLEISMDFFPLVESLDGPWSTVPWSDEYMTVDLNGASISIGPLNEDGVAGQFEGTVLSPDSGPISYVLTPTDDSGVTKYNLTFFAPNGFVGDDLKVSINTDSGGSIKNSALLIDNFEIKQLPTTVYEETFQTNQGPLIDKGWDVPGGYTFDTDIYQFNNENMFSWNSSNDNTGIEKSLDLEKSIEIEVDFFEVYGWNGDEMLVEINGVEMSLGTFSESSKIEEGYIGHITAEDGKQISWEMSSDPTGESTLFPTKQQHKVVFSIDGGFFSESLEIKFKPELNGGAFGEEMFGLSNFKIIQ